MNLVWIDQTFRKKLVPNALGHGLRDINEFRVVFDHLRIVRINIVDRFAIGAHKALKHVFSIFQNGYVSDQNSDGLAADKSGIGGLGDDVNLAILDLLETE